MEALAFVRRENNLWYVYSKDGKKLSKGYKSKNDALKRLSEIEYFKNKDEK